MVLLESWKAFETEHGGEEEVAKVQGMMPQIIKRWRKADESGALEECELFLFFFLPALASLCFLACVLLEFRSLILHFYIDWDMLFADDEREANPTSFKLLQMAHAWKNAQANAGAGSDSDSDESDDEEMDGVAPGGEGRAAAQEEESDSE